MRTSPRTMAPPEGPILGALDLPSAPSSSPPPSSANRSAAMVRKPYSVATIDLTSAGSIDLNAYGNVLAVEFTGTDWFKGTVLIGLGTDGARYPLFPFHPGRRVTRQWFNGLRVSWAAQPGVMAYILTQTDPEA